MRMAISFMAGYTTGCSYREEPDVACTFSQLATALGLRQGLREVLHRRKSKHVSPWLKIGERGELVVLQLLRQVDERWNHALPSQPAYLPRNPQGQPHGLYCGNADLFLATVPPAVGEAKFLCTRELPRGDEIPVDYRPQLEAEMRSNFVDTAYLVMLRLPEVPQLEQVELWRSRALRGERLCIPGAVLAVWEYRRDDRFWAEFVLPGLARFEEWQRHCQGRPDFCPTRRRNHKCHDPHYHPVSEQLIIAESHCSRGQSRLVLYQHMFAPSPLAGPGLLLYCDTQQGCKAESAEAEEEESVDMECEHERLNWARAYAEGCARLERLLEGEPAWVRPAGSNNKSV